MKKLITILITLMLLCITLCPAGLAEEAPAAVAIPDITVKQFDIPDTEALRFVRSLKIGWNLGNTFDAYDCNWLSNEMDYEGAWCKAKTTETHIQMLKDAGFNAIRIPVSWHNHLSDKETYTISEPWLNRVAEVVGWCLDRDMYVILNIHHDNSKDFLYPSAAYREQSLAYVKAIWTQLAERFRDCDEHLIFGSMNEPRLVGHANEWWIDNNSTECQESMAIINELNQLFVDTVRASGGNNATRYLLCPGYDASPEGALNPAYVLPTDPVESNDHHIIVSVHAYTPYDFALDEKGTDTWTCFDTSDTSRLVPFMKSLYEHYVSQGIPVIIDEFGARDKGGNLASRVEFAAYYVAAARSRGMTCFWWDNNALEGSGELFCILNRQKNEWAYPEIVEAMMKYAE